MKQNKNMINGSERTFDNDDLRERVTKRPQNNKKITKKKNYLNVNKSLISLWSYFFFIVIRIVLVFIPQYGYIHPDEFFQTTEVISGKCH